VSFADPNAFSSCLTTDSFVFFFWHNDISRIGLLKVGVPKTWDDSQKNLGYIRNAGVKQFMSTYNRVKDLKGDALLWGDEIEYGVFRIDPETKKVRLSLRAKEVSVENSSSDRAEISTFCM
jgi:hypothetical protein